MSDLYVPGSHGEEPPQEEASTADEHGYEIPKPGAEEPSATEYRTAFLVLIDNEGMASLRLNPNELELISVDRPAIPNDVFLACTMLLRDMNLTSMAQAAAELVMGMMMQQAQAVMQQQAQSQALDINAQREKARIDEAARRSGGRH